MYTRDYKNSSVGSFYHIYNRGNAKQPIFLEQGDYVFFLLRLRQNLKPNGTEGRFFRPLPTGAFTLISYCLMSNHYHLLIRQNSEIPTGKLIAKVCTSYSKYFNQKYGQVGHIFQDKFKQKEVLDNRYLLWLSAYIHLNPVEAGLVKNPGEYPWSSSVRYLERGADLMLEPDIVLDQFDGDYSRFLSEAQTAQEYRDIKSDIPE